MSKEYKLCKAITIIDWLFVPVVIILIALEVVAAIGIASTMDSYGNVDTSSIAIINVIDIVFILIIVAMIIAAVVCSIILLVKNDTTSPNSGLTIAVGVCGIVFPPANLIMGIMLCGKLKNESSTSANSNTPL